MGIAAFILGVISLIFSFLPFTHFLGIVPAIIGLIFGITDLIYAKKQGDKPQGFSISGVILCLVALGFETVWTILLFVAVI